MFVDLVNISVKAGDGGDGAVAFHREKYVAAGGPDGGDGGRGGNIVFLVDDNLSTLIDFRFKRKFVADSGENGSGSNCSGKKGKDLVIRVPRGTLIKEALSGSLIADMSQAQPVIICKGGNGGWGNQHFATPTRQIPRFAKPGRPGEGFKLTLELKLLADVGLVGFPNVGKSTLVSVVSAAKPKIANYHFTTLSPILGVVRIDDERSFVMADIPGLIEGASEGIGLGHSFLRHVERCRLIVHIVDVSGIEGRDPKDDFEKINEELKNFSPDLANAPQIVAANKSDIASAQQIEAFKTYIEAKGFPFYTISAATQQGTRELVQGVFKQLIELPPLKTYVPDYVPPTPEPEGKFKIHKEGDEFIIEAQWLEPVMKGIDPEDYESLQYFQKVLMSRGIIDKLVSMGVEEGDTVKIFDFAFSYLS